ncbi:restriction endonuclease subunit S [Mesomycoplasma ovipneumoniae]
MNEWKKVKISEIGKIVTGKTPKTSNSSFYGGKTPFFTPSDDWSTKYIKNTNKYLTEDGKNSVKGSIIPKNAVCVSCIGIIGKVAITSSETVTNQQINSIIVDETKYDIDFIYYAMLELAKVLNLHSGSSTVVPIINKNTFSEYKLACPKLDEQKKIANVLSIIDKKIEINKQINDNLANMAQDIYMHWFFKKSPNGKLKDILLEAAKSNVQVGDAKNCIGQYPFFTSGASILTWNKYFVNGRYCFLNTGGNADVKFYVGKSSYSTDTWCIYTKNDMNDYLYLLLLTIKEELNKKYFQGTGLKHLQKYLLINKDIYIPTESELFNFNNIVKPIFDNISSNKRETEKLATLRDYLLPLLLNGQVNIED